jgi:hypothetical protein
MLGSTRKIDAESAIDEVPLAVVGIVPCKVTTENGPIKAGDLLVTSSLPGHAMKGTDKSKMLGAVVGKALQSIETYSSLGDTAIGLHFRQALTRVASGHPCNLDINGQVLVAPEDFSKGPSGS